MEQSMEAYYLKKGLNYVDYIFCLTLLKLIRMVFSLLFVAILFLIFLESILILIMNFFILRFFLLFYSFLYKFIYCYSYIKKKFFETYQLFKKSIS